MGPRGLVLVGILFLGARGAGADEEARRPLLARIADAKDPGREEALSAWKALSADDRAAIARAGLRSTDPGLALAAAVAADPERLDLEELRGQAAALAPDPLARLVVPSALSPLLSGPHAFGSRDLPAIWAAIAQRDPDPEALPFSALHRSLLPEDVPALVPLLESARPRAFRALLDDLRVVSEQQAGDEHRADFVRAFRYALARLRAEKAGKARPRLAGLPALPAKAGLPAEFVELAKGAWSDEATGFGLARPPGKEGYAAPHAWLHHWALDLAPVDEDVEFLLATFQAAKATLEARVWAARKIARLSGRAAGHALATALGSKDPAALYAAAERAAAGDAADWKRLVGAGGDLGTTRKEAYATARWVADAAAARAEAFEEIRKGNFPKEIEQDERWFAEHDLGVEIREADLAWISERVRADALPVASEAWFYAKAMPEALTPDVAARVCGSWAGRLGDVDPREKDVERAVALLDAQAPDAATAMLRRWATTAAGDAARRAALVLLARAGDAALVDAMLAAWASSLDEPQPQALGRVHDPKVESFLRAKAEAKEAGGETEATAVAALAVFYGCPEPLSRYLGASARGSNKDGDARWSEAKALVLAKDPVGAALRIARDDPWAAGEAGAFAGFGLASDDRTKTLLSAWREARTAYWPATAALALAGNAAARSEWTAFLAEARSFLLDDLVDGRLCTLDGDPDMTAFWVSRLDSNCCHALQAHAVLVAAYPTMPVSLSPGDAGRARTGAERWFARHRGTFVRSRLLDGWLPGPPH